MESDFRHGYEAGDHEAYAAHEASAMLEAEAEKKYYG